MLIEQFLIIFFFIKHTFSLISLKEQYYAISLLAPDNNDTFYIKSRENDWNIIQIEYSITSSIPNDIIIDYIFESQKEILTYKNDTTIEYLLTSYEHNNHIIRIKLPDELDGQILFHFCYKSNNQNTNEEITYLIKYASYKTEEEIVHFEFNQTISAMGEKTIISIYANPIIYRYDIESIDYIIYQFDKNEYDIKSNLQSFLPKTYTKKTLIKDANRYSKQIYRLIYGILIMEIILIL